MNYQDTINVVVGLIFNANNQVLLTRRSLSISHGGYWEFPGGKVEPDESLPDALKREFLEELGIIIEDAKQVLSFEYDYADYALSLQVFEIIEFTGKPQLCEGQLAMSWADLHTLKDYKFPEANQSIVDYLLSHDKDTTYLK